MSEPKGRRRGSASQSIGGVLFGFEQQVWRNVPPPQELVHHARPDDPVPAADGSFLHIALPGGGEDGHAGEDGPGDDAPPVAGRDGVGTSRPAPDAGSGRSGG